MKLFIDNYYTYTYSTIPAEHKVIWDRLKYFNENFEHVNRVTGGSWDGFSSMYNVRVSKGYFYTGFLEWILDELQSIRCNIEIEDRRIIPEKTIFVKDLNYELRDYQERTMKEILAQPRGNLSGTMGFGKTIASLDIFASLGVKTLILVHRKNLMNQSYKEYREKAPTASVGRMGDGKFELGKDFTVGIINTVAGRLKRKPDTILPFLQGLGCIISDEGHVATNKQFQSVLEASGAYYRYGMSGTFNMRNSQANLESVGLYGDIKSETNADELIEKEHLSQVYYKQIDVGFPESLRGVRSKAEAYERGVTYSRYRNTLIIETAFKFLTNGYHPVILFKFRDHGEMIEETLKELYPHIRYALMHGDSLTEERKKIQDDYNAGEIDIIISSLIFSTGVDVPKIDNIIWAGGGRAEAELLQIGGRGSRKKDKMKAFFIDFNDRFNIGMQEDSEKRRRAVEKYPGYLVLN